MPRHITAPKITRHAASDAMSTARRAASIHLATRALVIAAQPTAPLASAIFAGVAAVRELERARRRQLEPGADPARAQLVAARLVERRQDRVRVILVGRDVEIDPEPTALVAAGQRAMHPAPRRLLGAAEHLARRLDQRVERAVVERLGVLLVAA